MERSYLKILSAVRLAVLFSSQPQLVTQKIQLSWQCSLKSDNHETIWCEMDQGLATYIKSSLQN